MNVEIGNLMMELEKDERVEVRGENSLWEENVSFQGDIASNWSAEKYFPCYAHTPLNCKGIQECLGFQIPIQGSRFQALNASLWWWKLDSGLQLLVKCQIPKAMILDSKGKIFRDSGFHEQSFSNYGIRIPLTWGDLYLGLKGLGTAEPAEPADAT